VSIERLFSLHALRYNVSSEHLFFLIQNHIFRMKNQEAEHYCCNVQPRQHVVGEDHRHGEVSNLNGIGFGERQADVGLIPRLYKVHIVRIETKLGCCLCCSLCS